MENFTPISALLGGAMIGVAASIMLLFTGRIAGISGIYGGLLRFKPGDVGWRLAFIGGLVLAGLGLWIFDPQTIMPTVTRTVWVTGLAGLIVGVGVRMGNGCTSGHGICGLTRFSPRSLVATITFLGTGFATASLIQLLAGGSL